MKEHEVKETLTIDEDYPEHETRADSVVFEHTRKSMDKAGDVCMVCADAHTEKHHGAVEWAFSNGVDWQAVKDIATGKQPLFRGVPAEKMLIFWLCKVAELRGFDWDAFDPTKPEDIVDSPYWMVPLCEPHHRGKDKGVHMMDFPHWIIQAFPLVKGFGLFQDV